MFGSLGLPEILFIAVVALLVFGPRRLPEIGRTMGRFLGEFRRATTDLKQTIDAEVTLEEVRQPPASATPAAAGAPAAAPQAEPTTEPTAEPATAEPAVAGEDEPPADPEAGPKAGPAAAEGDSSG